MLLDDIRYLRRHAFRFLLSLVGRDRVRWKEFSRRVLPAVHGEDVNYFFSSYLYSLQDGIAHFQGWIVWHLLLLADLQAAGPERC